MTPTGSSRFNPRFCSRRASLLADSFSSLYVTDPPSYRIAI
nr:hypothetical protein [Bacillus velezensis]